MTLQIDFSDFSSELLEALDDVRGLLATAPASEVAAAGAAYAVKDRFGELASSRHRSAAPFNFYDAAADATTVDGNKIIVAKTGIRQRYYGGDITGKGGKHLTIPLNDAALQGPARDFEDLFLIRSKRGNKLLVYQSGKDEITPLFLLKRTVHQDADHSILPTDSDMSAAMHDALDGYLLSEAGI